MEAADSIRDRTIAGEPSAAPHRPLPVIIGAGPAGLTAAYALAQRNQSTLILERDNQVGGLAKTVRYKGFSFDIGGHRFFTKMTEIETLWRRVLGPDFLRVPRLSRIYYRGQFFDYPLKAWNALSLLGPVETVRILMSYLHAQFFPARPEEFFEQYVSNRFGPRLYKLFFKTYTEKVWGIPCSEIRAEWAAQRIKGLSLFTTIRQALLGNRARVVKSLIEEFDYPVLGPGHLWETMAEEVRRTGSHILLDARVVKIRHDGQAISEVWTERGGVYAAYPVTHVLSSMPLRTMLHALYPAPPDEVIHAADQLKYRDLLVANLICRRPQVFPDNWLYIHDPAVRVGRIQNYKNWSARMVPSPDFTSLGLEYFCSETEELWNLDDKDLLGIAKQDLRTIGLVQPDEVVDGFIHRQKKAYPVYDRHFKDSLSRIQAYLARFQNLFVMGRNGMHKYNNQDHSMLTALLAVENMHGAAHDLWNVNSDLDYQELMVVSKKAEDQ